MKQLLRTLSVFLIVLAWLPIGCKKEGNTASNITLLPPDPPAPPAVKNTAPEVDAGHNVWLLIPGNPYSLNGIASDKENNIEKYVWKQVSGPAASIIEMADSLTTQLSNLIKGTYEFELTVTDKGGLYGKDTVTVEVRDEPAPGHGEAIISDLKWLCPMGCTIEVRCFSCFVPANQPYKIYLGRGSNGQWKEILPANSTDYFFQITNNTLLIGSATDMTFQSAEIRITF